MRQELKSPNHGKKERGLVFPRRFDSMQSLASAFTFDLEEVRRHKASGCTAFKHGYCMTEQYLEYRRAHPDNGGVGEDADERRAQEKHEVTMTKLRLEVEKEQGNLIHKDDVKREIATSSEAIMETLSRVLSKEDYNAVIKSVKEALLKEGSGKI